MIGTPGRIVDNLERGSLQLGAVTILVLDEADRILDMGFAEDVATIGRRCPKLRQTLLFSATYSDGLMQISSSFLRDPQEVTLAAQPSAGKILQRFYEVTEDQRLHAVGLLLNRWRLVRTLACPVTVTSLRSLKVSMRSLSTSISSGSLSSSTKRSRAPRTRRAWSASQLNDRTTMYASTASDTRFRDFGLMTTRDARVVAFAFANSSWEDVIVNALALLRLSTPVGDNSRSQMLRMTGRSGAKNWSGIWEGTYEVVQQLPRATGLGAKRSQGLPLVPVDACNRVHEPSKAVPSRTRANQRAFTWWRGVARSLRQGRGSRCACAGGRPA